VALVVVLATPGLLTGQRTRAATTTSGIRIGDARTIAGVDSIGRATVATGRVAGLTIAVARTGRPALVRAYGKADLALDVATPEHAVYEIGSITKQFTAVAILQLVERGRLSLDAELSTLLPAFRFSGPAITLRRLLDHTSGLPGYTEMAEFGALMPQALPRDSLARLIASKPRDFAPGDDMRYNNSAYFLLGLIIERASGISYEQYVARELFAPAGMTRSRYCSNVDIVPRSVQGYDLAGTTLQRARYLDQRWPYAGGSLCSTARDLLAWTAALHDGRLLRASGVRELLTPGTLSDGATTRYAAGLVVNDSLAGRLAIHHGGAIPGFASAMAYLPEDSLTVVVLLNTLGALNPTDLLEAVIGRVAGVRARTPRAIAASPEEWSGRYLAANRAGASGVLHVRAHPAGGVGIQLGRDSLQRADWRGGDTFAIGSTRVTFTRAQGRVTGARVDDVLNSRRYMRDDAGSVANTAAPATALPSVPTEAVSRYVGRYELREAPGQPALPLRVFEEDGQLAGQIRQNSPSRLEYLGDDRFRPVESPEFTVTFTMEHGRAIGIAMEAPGMRMTGERVDDPGRSPTTAPTGTTAEGSRAIMRSPLDATLARMDSLLFDAAFVVCDTARVFAMLTPDIEFYHDQTGAKRGADVRADFARLAAACPRGQGITRVLTPGSLQHFPIKDFGAMQTGEHRFVNANGEAPVAARFVHLWTNRDGAWRVSRIYSVDHAVQR
jgi:CubicO group peptidase (beta-lactamase class C family)